MDAPSLPESLMKKRLLLVLAFLCGLAAPAFAGDAAELEILGFSENGGIFAFEEYGVQDGSGFPYANRYYIDTEKDAYLPGTPVRIRLDDESATIEKARAQAREAGEKFVANDILARNRGNLAGFNAITELSADPLRMEVSPRAIFPPIDKKLEFRLEEYVLPSNAECMDSPFTHRHKRWRNHAHRSRRQNDPANQKLRAGLSHRRGPDLLSR